MSFVHFVGFSDQMPKHDQQIRALEACSTCLSSAILLRREIKQLKNANDQDPEFKTKIENISEQFAKLCVTLNSSVEAIVNRIQLQEVKRTSDEAAIKKIEEENLRVIENKREQDRINLLKKETLHQRPFAKKEITRADIEELAAKYVKAALENFRENKKSANVEKPAPTPVEDKSPTKPVEATVENSQPPKNDYEEVHGSLARSILESKEILLQYYQDLKLFSILRDELIQIKETASKLKNVRLDASKWETPLTEVPITNSEVQPSLTPELVSANYPLPYLPQQKTNGIHSSTTTTRSQEAAPVKSEPTVSLQIEEVSIGEMNSLGVCMEPDWAQKPVEFRNENGNWQGNVPVGKQFKFVILHSGEVRGWEQGLNENRIYHSAQSDRLKIYF